nr:26S proteasome non-ATPase regulatory subunit 5 [Polyrhizophydium stewartii]
MRASETLAACVERGDFSDTEALHAALTTWRVALTGYTRPGELASKFRLAPETIVGVMAGTRSLAVTELACNVLDGLLSQTPFPMILDAFGDLLRVGLRSPLVPVNKLVLALMRRGAVSADGTAAILAAGDILDALVAAIANKDSEVGKAVGELLAAIATQKGAIEAVLSNNNVAVLTDLADESAIIKLRIYELYATVAMSSNEAFEYCDRLGVLAPLSGRVFTSDVLETLNVIEILIQFAESRAGFEFLDKTQVLQQLFDAVQMPAEVEGIVARLSLCSAIKFWGFLYFNQHESIESIQAKYDFLSALQPYLEESEPDVRDAARVAIANIGSTAAGVCALFQQRVLLDSLLDSLKYSAGDVKISILRTVSCIIGVEHGGSEMAGQAAKYSYDRIKAANPNLIKDLIQFAKNTLEDLFVAAYSVLNAVLTHEWGLEELSRTPDFAAFVVQRQPGAPRLAMEWKFSLVRTISRHPAASTKVGGLLMERVRDYEKQGPYYTEAQPIVAMQSA